MGLILAIVSLAMDGGRMFDERRHAQAAADAAALAAAVDLFNNYATNSGLDPSGTAVTAALASAAANSFANDGVKSIVKVNIPPKSGDFSGQSGYAEVIITSNLTSSFSSGLTGGKSPVKARAVAVCPSKAAGTADVLLLATLGPAVTLSGNATADIAGTLTVNSTDPAAVTLTGNATLITDSTSVVGGYRADVYTTLRGSISTGASSTADPLAKLAVPPTKTTTTTTIKGKTRTITTPIPTRSSATLYYYSGDVATLNPGIYIGGISASGDANITLKPGTYFIEGGGIKLSGQSSLTANGVLIYNTSGSGLNYPGPISLSGGTQVNWTAPTSGTYKGIALFQDRSVTTKVQASGGGSMHIDGTLYAPGADMVFTGSSSATDQFGTGVIASTVTVTGSGRVTIGSASASGGSTGGRISLAE
jgi:hypothetical protein